MPVDMLKILLIAIGLAMDTFAVSITNGITVKHRRMPHAFRIAIFFGSFQALMPLFGWLTGRGLRGFISSVDHWVAFGLLSLIGGKMIYESVKSGSGEKGEKSLDVGVLLVLSIATSIDALAVGLSFAFLNVSIVAPILVIGLVTFSLSLLGVLVGNKVGHFFENKIEILGGIILIIIGIKILSEHLTPM